MPKHREKKAENSKGKIDILCFCFQYISHTLPKAVQSDQETLTLSIFFLLSSYPSNILPIPLLMISGTLSNVKYKNVYFVMRKYGNIVPRSLSYWARDLM